MQTYQPSLVARNDTLLGVCEAIGEDLGVNPTWLRVAFATLVFFNLTAAVALYLAAGAIVLASRLLFKAPRKVAVQQPVSTVSTPDAVDAENDDLLPVAVAA